MEKLLQVFIKLYVNHEHFNRSDLAEEIGVSERQITNYVKSINASLVNQGIYDEIVYDRLKKEYVIYDPKERE